MNSKMSMERQIREQGDLVRKLKAAKENKDKVRRRLCIFYGFYLWMYWHLFVPCTSGYKWVFTCHEFLQRGLPVFSK